MKRLITALCFVIFIAGCSSATVKEPTIFDAVNKGRVNDVKSFVDKDKNKINATDSNGSTVLMTSASLGNYTLVEYFVENGADTSRRDKEGYTVFDYAKRQTYNERINNYLETRKIPAPARSIFDDIFGFFKFW
jgi:ankyrin repeat protein